MLQIIIEGTMISDLYLKIFSKKVRSSVYELKLNRNWVMQQDNDQRHKSKSTSEWLKINKI